MIIGIIPCTLVADHVSYDSFINPFDGSKNKLDILLTPKVVSIEEVKITGKRYRKKNLRFFYSHFIKNDKNKIEILNDSVLYFKRNNKEFIAYTNEPLKKNSLKEMLAYEKNRRLYYFGFDRHFLKSVYQGNSKQQGFQLEIFPKNQNLYGIRKVENFYTGFAGKNFIVDCDSLKVTYRYGKNRYPYTYSLQNKSTSPYLDISTIYRSNVIFTLRENGTSPDVSFIITRPMTSVNNLANSLPMDYDPF